MLQDLALVMRLQTVDRKIASLEKEIATLPKHIAEIEKKLEAHTRKLEIDRAALAANQRDRKKLEGDIQTHETKISKLRGQMLDAKTNEQYRAFQNEITFCETEIRKAEDSILDSMEQAESLDGRVKTATQELKQQTEMVNRDKESATQTTKSHQQELTTLQAERGKLVTDIGPKLSVDYERVRKKTKGTVIAEAVEGRCEGCHIAMRPQFYQDLRKGDAIMHCESCGRMLVYNPVISFDNETAAALPRP